MKTVLSYCLETWHADREWWVNDLINFSKKEKKKKKKKKKIQDGRHGRRLENLFFASSPEPKGQLTRYLLGSIEVTCGLKIAQIMPIRNPRSPPCSHLENLFFAFSPKPKSQLTPNMVGSIGVTYRSKIAKIFRSEIQDGRYGSYLENLFFASPPEPKGQLTPNLLGIIVVTCRSKIAKIVLIVNPMAAILKFYFSLLLLTPYANWIETW